jgi:hypothetical protein
MDKSRGFRGANMVEQTNYLTKNMEGTLGMLQLPHHWQQHFPREYSMTNGISESMAIRWFNQSPSEYHPGLDILSCLLEFVFATPGQLRRLLEAKGHFCPEGVDKLLDKYYGQRMVNRFSLGVDAGDKAEQDLLYIYCLDYNGKHVLAHYGDGDEDAIVGWQSTDAKRSSPSIAKRLAVTEFYLTLVEGKSRTMKFFWPRPKLGLGKKRFSLSGRFQIMNGFTPLQFLMDCVPTDDIYGKWDQKLYESMSPYIQSGDWSKQFPVEPTVLLLAETMETAKRAAELYAGCIGPNKMRVTTYEHMLRGLGEMTFYKQDPSLGLVPVKSSTLVPDQTES